MQARRLDQFVRGQAFQIQVDDRMLPAFEGETIATVLMAAGIITFHHDVQVGVDSRLYCGIGVCQQCLTLVDGKLCQACRTLARPGMKVETRPCQS